MEFGELGLKSEIFEIKRCRYRLKSVDLAIFVG